MTPSFVRKTNPWFKKREMSSSNVTFESDKGHQRPWRSSYLRIFQTGLLVLLRLVCIHTRCYIYVLLRIFRVNRCASFNPPSWLNVWNNLTTNYASYFFSYKGNLTRKPLEVYNAESHEIWLIQKIN